MSTNRRRTVTFVAIVGLLVGAVVGLVKGEGIGGIVLEALEGGFIAGAVSLGAVGADNRRRRGDRD